MITSALIADRIKNKGGTYFANDNISKYLEHGELEQLEKELIPQLENVLKGLVIDTTNDHNTQETAKRIAKMYIREVFKGRYLEQPTVTDFPNAKNLDQIYTLGPITVRSACSHHMVPIIGQAWIGIIPSKRVIGISKFIRLTEWVMARPQIQEEATIQLADLIEDLIKPIGLAIVIKAQHECMIWRGVKETETSMVTSVMRGEFMKDSDARAECLKLMEKQ
jgi:GTP cyclohydrolase I